MDFNVLLITGSLCVWDQNYSCPATAAIGVHTVLLTVAATVILTSHCTRDGILLTDKNPYLTVHLH